MINKANLSIPGNISGVSVQNRTSLKSKSRGHKNYSNFKINENIFLQKIRNKTKIKIPMSLNLVLRSYQDCTTFSSDKILIFKIDPSSYQFRVFK